MKAFIPVLLLLCSPVSAQVLMSYSAAKQYCMLRNAGVDRELAQKMAIRANLTRFGTPEYTMVDGVRRRVDVTEFVNYTMGCH
jgi:hypothetical protein